MYFNSETAHAARMAALDHCRAAAGILLDSTARMLDLYNDTRGKALGIARHAEFQSTPAAFGQLLPDLLAGHLRIAGHAHEDLIRLVESQIHVSGSLAKFTLDKTAQISPPLVEFAIDTAESIIAAGENVVDELGDASLKAVGAVEKKLARPAPARKKNRN
ncbi:MAG: hypothetical protein HZC24_02540 [Rhodocyclales bacterium]|nr:hypothetical protein [Rhodocyclales bacterium]